MEEPLTIFLSQKSRRMLQRFLCLRDDAADKLGRKDDVPDQANALPSGGQQFTLTALAGWQPSLRPASAPLPASRPPADAAIAR